MSCTILGMLLDNWNSVAIYLLECPCLNTSQQLHRERWAHLLPSFHVNNWQHTMGMTISSHGHSHWLESS